MTKITDMLGQEVKVGDRIASPRRTAYGTVPEMRVGTVIAIKQRRSTQKNRGNTSPKEDFLRVRWEASSYFAQIKLGVREMYENRLSMGRPIGRPAILDNDYEPKVSEIMVSLKRFLKIG